MKLKDWRDPNIGCFGLLIWLVLIFGTLTFIHFIVASLVIWAINLVLANPLIVTWSGKWVIAAVVTIVRIILYKTR